MVEVVEEVGVVFEVEGVVWIEAGGRRATGTSPPVYLAIGSCFRIVSTICLVRYCDLLPRLPLLHFYQCDRS